MTNVQTLEELEEQIRINQRLIKEMEAQKQKMLKDRETVSETGQLAIFLHNRLCRWNHMDGCGWYYGVYDGVHDWKQDEHRCWWKKAETLLSKKYTCEQVMDIIDITKS